MFKTFIVKPKIKSKSLNKIYYIDKYNYISAVEFIGSYSECAWSEAKIIENFKLKYWIRTNHKTPEIIRNRGGRGERI